MPDVLCPFCRGAVSLLHERQAYTCPHCNNVVRDGTEEPEPEPERRRERRERREYREERERPKYPQPMGWFATMTAVMVGVILGGIVLWKIFDTSLEYRISNGVRDAIKK